MHKWTTVWGYAIECILKINHSIKWNQKRDETSVVTRDYEKCLIVVCFRLLKGLRNGIKISIIESPESHKNKLYGLGSQRRWFFSFNADRTPSTSSASPTKLSRIYQFPHSDSDNSNRVRRSGFDRNCKLCYEHKKSLSKRQKKSFRLNASK